MGEYGGVNIVLRIASQSAFFNRGFDMCFAFCFGYWTIGPPSVVGYPYFDQCYGGSYSVVNSMVQNIHWGYFLTSMLPTTCRYFLVHHHMLVFQLDHLSVIWNKQHENTSFLPAVHHHLPGYSWYIGWLKHVPPNQEVCDGLCSFSFISHFRGHWPFWNAYNKFCSRCIRKAGGADWRLDDLAY